MTSIITIPDPRGQALARALGGRIVRGKMFLAGRKAGQYQALYEAGFWAVRRGASVLYRRDPKAMDLYKALELCRNVRPAAISSLTANDESGQTTIPNQD